jgi:hypothetical protein
MGLRLSRPVPAIKMASSSMTATSASEEDNSAQLQGHFGWEGSEVTLADISWITSTRRVPDGVSCRLPAGETVPTPEPDERIVFIAHFERGLVCRRQISFGTSSTPTICNLTISWPMR